MIRRIKQIPRTLAKPGKSSRTILSPAAQFSVDILDAIFAVLGADLAHNQATLLYAYMLRLNEVGQRTHALDWPQLTQSDAFRLRIYPRTS